LITWEATRISVTTTATVHASPVRSASAHNQIAAPASNVPGSSGTTTPTTATNRARPTSNSPVVSTR
jgi:hypothetical protein